MALAAQAQTTLVPTFLAGGDVSVLTLAESKNARYYNRAGQRQDAITILCAVGFNLARLRLYDQPGPGNGNDGWHCPAGSQDLPDIQLSLGDHLAHGAVLHQDR